MIQNAITKGSLNPSSFLPKTDSDPAATMNPSKACPPGRLSDMTTGPQSDGIKEAASNAKISSNESFSLEARRHVGTK